ncbi:MAG: PP2C family protein-serine/threonine phosphatase [Rhodothermales bacterium]
MIEDNRLGIALGDVAGKGLGAAMFMAKLQSTLRAIAPNFESLAALGAQVNAIFRRDGLPSRFVSLVYLELEPNNGAVRLLNAGHLPPLVVRGETVEELPKGSPALGIMSDVDYTEQHVRLSEHDFLLVYSDGLTEARNEQGDFFETQRLKELLPSLSGLTARRTGERLLSAVKAFEGDTRPSDDLSLVLLKRTGAVKRLASSKAEE